MHSPKENFVKEIDLGEMWNEWTGLPFVFAMWVAQSDADTSGIAAALSEARNRGVNRLKTIAQSEAPKLGLSEQVAYNYLTQNLHYKMSSAELNGLQLFHELASQHNLVNQNANRVFSDFVTA